MHHGNRGMAFENLINMANIQYENGGVAMINKSPTPVKVLKSNGHKVINGVYESKSTVDYDGVYKGRAIYFEAKTVKGRRFDLKNIHDHQIKHLEKAHKLGAVCFLLIEFSDSRTIYYVPFTVMKHYIDNSKVKDAKKGSKSIPQDDFDVYAYGVKGSARCLLDYLVWVDELYGIEAKAN